MALLSLFKTRKYRNFMAKLYGWGASVVIIGALFKINHYAGADIMLIIGLGTESIIFFFSAFEPPHVEPDWSMVYPQLAGIYHGDDLDASKALATGETVTQELDKMLTKSKIGPELIDSLGNGLRNLSDTTAKLSNISDASLANDQYVNTIKKATESAGSLSESYTKTAKTLDHSAQISQDQANNMKAASDNAANLSGVYAQVSQSLQTEITLNKELTDSISHVATSANKFVQKYNESTEILSKTTETLVSSASEGQIYNQQLEKVSSNLAALNAMYELHLQNSNIQMENTNKFNTISGQLVETLGETTSSTGKFKDNLVALNKIMEMQVRTSTDQVQDSTKMHESVQQFLVNLQESVDRTSHFKTEVDSLAKNIAALNKVYGNMLSALNVTIK
jgi:gliding motility-associated protein GldL